jgi:3-oxoacyl-[acyl-carrier-protein] synthase-3
VVCAEQISRLADWTDRSTCVLFGDAAGAAVCEVGDGLKAIRLTARGNADLLYGWPDGGNSPFLENRVAAQPLFMNGQEVFKFAVTHSSRDIEAVLADTGLTPAQVDHFVLLSEMTEDGSLQKGQTLVLSAFGAGLTTGAAVLQY